MHHQFDAKEKIWIVKWMNINLIHRLFYKFSGDNTAGEIPLPIPNREDKPRRADGTIRVTVWESRSLPGVF